MIGTDVGFAVQLLQAGKLVAIPTETVYGLAGNAFSEEAVSAIFAVKQRPVFDPLIVHTSSIERLTQLALELPEAAYTLAQHFMPGPLTLLVPKAAVIPDLVTAGSPLVALRIPRHPLTLQVLESLDFPLAAPSANPFGYISPTTAAHVAQQLGTKIPYILDGGSCQVGLESTIVGFPEGRKPVVLRKGGLSVESIEAAIGPVDVRVHSSSNPQAPGMLKSHYAPRIPLQIGDIETLLRIHNGKRIGILSFQRCVPGIEPKYQVQLSVDGDYAEAARNLFSGMRYLDGLELDLLLAEWVPEKDLGRAINDRLRRAAAEK